jgi:hypothetical protein
VVIIRREAATQNRFPLIHYKAICKPMAANVTYPTIARYIGKGDRFQSWIRLQRFGMSELLQRPSSPFAIKRERVMSLTATVYNLCKVIGRQNPKLLRIGMGKELQAAANHAYLAKESHRLIRVADMDWRLLSELDSAVKRSNVPLNLMSAMAPKQSDPVITEISDAPVVSWDDIKRMPTSPPLLQDARGLHREDVHATGRIEGIASLPSGCQRRCTKRAT